MYTNYNFWYYPELILIIITNFKFNGNIGRTHNKRVTKTIGDIILVNIIYNSKIWNILSEFLKHTKLI